MWGRDTWTHFWFVESLEGKRSGSHSEWRKLVPGVSSPPTPPISWYKPASRPSKCYVCHLHGEWPSRRLQNGVEADVWMKTARKWWSSPFSGTFGGGGRGVRSRHFGHGAFVTIPLVTMFSLINQMSLFFLSMWVVVWIFWCLEGLSHPGDCKGVLFICKWFEHLAWPQPLPTHSFGNGHRGDVCRKRWNVRIKMKSFHFSVALLLFGA